MMGIGLGVIVVIIVMFGNLVVYVQINMKCLLVYFMIVHVGYMFMVIVVLFVVFGDLGNSGGVGW